MQQTDERLGLLIRWMKNTGIQLRGCTIRQNSEHGGYGVFAGDEEARDVLMVSPLTRSLTALTILKDPLLGTQYRDMLQSDVDERLLVMIFLIVERARGTSSFWCPYLEMLPSDFGTPLWYTEDELVELKGTSLYKATNAQLRSLKRLFENNVKKFSEIALSAVGLESCDIGFKDFLWANCIFWTRALNIPYPASFKLEQDEVGDASTEGDVVWTEGLVPGIDFCNHVRNSGALWEVDGKSGSTSGVPHSMYLLAVPDVRFAPNSEICIDYGDKGNEELLFLYGFVEDNNPNDYIMVHFPMETMEQSPCIEYKLQLLQEQGMLLRWLLPSSYLEGGFLDASGKCKAVASQRNMGYSWSGFRKPPSYLSSLVFPDEMLSTLRVLAMSEIAFQNVAELLEELTHVPSKDDILAAVWEVCGDVQALTLLVDMFSAKMAELVQGTGTEDQDEELLCRGELRSSNHRASVVYRKGQKNLVRRFLKEAEMALAACLNEDEP